MGVRALGHRLNSDVPIVESAENFRVGSEQEASFCFDIAVHATPQLDIARGDRTVDYC